MVYFAHSVGIDRFVCGGTGADLPDGLSAAGADEAAVAAGGGRRAGRAGAGVDQPGGHGVRLFDQRQSLHGHGRGLSGAAGRAAAGDFAAADVICNFMLQIPLVLCYTLHGD